MLNNLQTLRAFAALNVVLFHIIEIGSEHGFAVSSLEFLRGWGANGVDIFFVLSGFIMVYISELRPRSPLSFLQNRAIRVVPMYWILTLTGVALILLAGDFRGEPVSAEPILASVLFMTRWTTMDFPILYVGWTLEWELLFYLIFGMCLLFKNKIVQFTLPLIILAALVMFGGQNSIILEFGFGMIIAKLSKLQSVRDSAGLMALTGVFMLATSIWVKSTLPQFIIWGLPSAMLVLGLATTRQWKFPLGEHLGNASYSIYLIQVFTIPVFYRAAEKIAPNMSTLWLAMACLILTALAGSLFHLAVEKPVGKLLMGKIRPARQPWVKPKPAIA